VSQPQKYAFYYQKLKW